MKSSSILRSLTEDYGINSVVAEEAALVAERQRSDFSTYGDFFNRMGVSEGKRKHYDGYSPIDILDIPARAVDPRWTILVHTAMASVFDSNLLYQLATISHMIPEARIIAAGNTGAFGFPASRILTHAQRRLVANGNFSPVADPLLKYADEQRVETAVHYAYSYGVEVGATAMKSAVHDVEKAVLLDPATAHTWKQKLPLVGLARLGLAFASAGEPMAQYVHESAMPQFDKAIEDSPGLFMYSLGLLRPTNFAISRGLALGGFVERATSALEAQAGAQLTFAWSTESEFNINNATDIAAQSLVERFGDRTVLHPLEGHKHAVANNIFFQAALLKQVIDAPSVPSSL